MIIESIGPHGHGFTNGAWCVWQVGDQKKRDFFEFATLCSADTKTDGATRGKAVGAPRQE